MSVEEVDRSLAPCGQPLFHPTGHVCLREGRAQTANTDPTRLTLYLYTLLQFEVKFYCTDMHLIEFV